MQMAEQLEQAVGQDQPEEPQGVALGDHPGGGLAEVRPRWRSACRRPNTQPAAPPAKARNDTMMLFVVTSVKNRAWGWSE